MTTTIKPTTTSTTSSAAPTAPATTTTTHIPNYQYNNINVPPQSTINNSNQYHKSILQQPPQNNILSTSPAYSNNYLMYQSTVRDINGSQNSHNSSQQSIEIIQPPPMLMPKTSFYEKNGHSLYGKGGGNQTKQMSGQKTGNSETERNIVSEMNQMYKHSPFMHRRCEVAESEYGSSPPIGGTQHQQATAQKESIYNNLGKYLIVYV